ncbi:MAG: ferritin-like domain-containing protein [Acetobacter sp.]|nr:ferritin-like domain-containing protein [Acetobacter sp.]MBO6091509.1 ferritin-like domain-containing protein [Acetobacter sp.]MBQ5497506.1 ferritin-like domain-containing protein [Acetobacter sp.]MBQ5516106.1 ferritin-like domain-containing protein [Acetobacter sp.]MBQ5545897.1 ferritin-like domain-containing protein [Acetobacter sp.]
MDSLSDIYTHLPDSVDDLPTPPNEQAIVEADYRARHWTCPDPGPLRPGSEEHKRAVAAMFRDTFNPYKPSVIDWPKLDPETLHKIVSLPIWDIAVQTEGKARLRMAAYAKLVEDPDMRDAIARNAWEENRHKEVLARMVAAYNIPMAPEPPYIEPKDVEWAYMVTGFSECIDSFFAFGMFELARRSGFFPQELIDTFEPVMQEETRHILLFANWLAWYRAVMPWWRRPFFELKVWGVWAFLAYERMRLVRTVDDKGQEHTQDNNFTVTGTKDMTNAKISLPDFMELCLSEDARRFSGYDPRLLRPTTPPFIARVIRNVGRCWEFVRSLY